MFYSEAILSRRGPLAKVWLAAHMERKLSKTQTLQTDIEQSVDAIMGQEVEVMALRLSGQLLLGVVRIYSRKAKYLLDDCNEALLKIKMAFRPGIVDMTEDQLAVNRNAITLQGTNLDLDALLPDINWDVDFEHRVVQPGGQHIARSADITLATDDFHLDFDEPGYGFDLGPTDGIGSQDFEEIDLGLDFGDGPVSAAAEQARAQDDDESMASEVGRDAAPQRGVRESLDSHLLGPRGDDMDLDILSHRSREPSEHPYGGDGLDFGPDVDMEDIDLGITFGDQPPIEVERLASEHPLSEKAPTERAPSEQPAVPFPEPIEAELEKAPSEREATPHLTPSRASSPLTEPPQTPPPEVVDLTPRADLKGKRKPKERKQIIDTVTELADGPGARVGRGRGAQLQPAKDVSDIVTEHPFLPRSSLVMRLLEVREDPLAHFLPTKVTPNGTFFLAAPPGMAPELAELFMRPVQTLAAPKRRPSPEKEQEEGPSKRPRLEGSVAPEQEEEEQPSPGQGRRAPSLAPSVALGSEVLAPRASVGPGLDFGDQTIPHDDFEMEVPEFEMEAEIPVPAPQERGKSVLSELSRLSSPGPEAAVVYEEVEEPIPDIACPIALFDDRSSQSQDQASQATSSDDGKGYSKNTVKALGVIRKELQPVPGEEEDKAMSFKTMSTKASRRAASSFFFELLVLGTRDCIKVTQEVPFADIKVSAKPKLWERQRHDSVAPSMSSQVPPPSFRQPSVAPSIASRRRQGSVAASVSSTFGL